MSVIPSLRCSKCRMYNLKEYMCKVYETTPAGWRVFNICASCFDNRHTYYERMKKFGILVRSL